MFSCALLQIPTIVFVHGLTVYIEIVVTADCKLLPWQQMKMLPKYLLSSCVAKVMGHIFLVLRIGLIPLVCNPLCILYHSDFSEIL